jgi:hypothetical protein
MPRLQIELTAYINLTVCTSLILLLFCRAARPETSDERGAVEAKDIHGIDSGGFSDVPLGSPPQRVSQNMSNGNSLKPSLDQVARSLANFGGQASEGGYTETRLAMEQLRAENARLKQRLQAVEDVSLWAPPACVLPVLESRWNTGSAYSTCCFLWLMLIYVMLAAACCLQSRMSALPGKLNMG